MTTRFKEVSQIHQRGDTIVYRAKELPLDRAVVIKTFRNKRHEARRVMEEARALCKVRHDHIVEVYHVGEYSIPAEDPKTMTLGEDGGAQDKDGDVKWALVMEDLGNEAPLHYVSDNNGNQAALKIIAEIASALHHAHQRGIYHCDVKNGNVRIREGKAKLIDFGLVSRERTSGRPYGTPGYMAPEQERGEEPSDKTDVYGLGCLLYVLLQREEKAPTSGAEIALPSGSELKGAKRARIEKLLQRMLRVDPAKRPKMDEVVEIVQDCLSPAPRLISLGVGAVIAFSVIEIARMVHPSSSPASLNVPATSSESSKNGVFYVYKKGKEFSCLQLYTCYDRLITYICGASMKDFQSCHLINGDNDQNAKTFNGNICILKSRVKADKNYEKKVYIDNSKPCRQQ